MSIEQEPNFFYRFHPSQLIINQIGLKIRVCGGCSIPEDPQEPVSSMGVFKFNANRSAKHFYLYKSLFQLYRIKLP